MKKKILVDIFYLHVAQTGIRTYTESLIEAIEGNGKTGKYDYIVSPSFASIKSSTFFKGKTPKWKNLLFQFLYFFRKIVSLPLLSYWYRSDLVFSPDILSPLWARGTKISVLHDAFFWENPSHYNSVWRRFFLKMLDFSLRKNAHVVTITEHSKKQIQHYLGLPDRSIHVVYPATNIAAKPKAPTSHSLLDSRYFLHVGVMEKRKNLVTLIRAYSYFLKASEEDDFKLVLVGQRGPRKDLDDYDNVLSQIAELGLQEKVVLPGFVSREVLERYYQHAFAYIFPSLNEGFGMPVLEAFSYQLPVIISRQGALMEVGGDAVSCPVDNSPKAFSEEMQRVVEDPTLRKTLIQKGNQRLTRFSGKRFLVDLEACFSKILRA
ncbi:glycosyltransferase family 1 protein [Echinicola strongylocentroti]|uniref:Glycosyltransferase family 1 protein n=1 Tax=Echinicola strongylocentroti TaxID=1795355 RepID=A0A2Z4II16_9BACT|nr:glycosyltransferase family 1 protein [Echinicola strongylocentroti]AWW30604.1 glycosyltransferase family 1 protein [Echinicola strongylocentroti]